MLSKWYVYVIAALVYTLGVVHVTKTYVNEAWTKQQLRSTEEQLKRNSENERLKNELSKALQDALAKQDRDNKQFTRELLNEITNDPRYKSCRTTDGVRRALQRKLDSQPQ